MDAQSDTFGYAQGAVRTLEPGFFRAIDENPGFVDEQRSDRLRVQTPKFGKLLRREMLLLSEV